MSIDPRMAARRSEVREVAARADARRTLWWIAGIGVLAVAIWVAQGPLFAITDVAVTGAVRTDPARALAAGGIEVGRPIAFVRTGAALEALATDPWVADAEIEVAYPHQVSVAIEERTPAVVVRSDTGMFVVADDGVVVARGDGGGDLPIADLPAAGPGVPGDLAGPDAAAAAAFMAALPDDLAHSGTVRVEGGELWFALADVAVRLGRPAEMAAKADTLVALLEDGVVPGATIHLVTPRRPAVEQPAGDPQPAGADGDDETDGGG